MTPGAKKVPTFPSAASPTKLYVMVCWDDYRFMLAVIREGNLSAAARSLAVSQPTVARRIEQLESELGVKLTSRDGAQIQVTEAGREIGRFAERIEGEASAIQESIERLRTGDRPHVRISTTRGLAHWLAPRLAKIEANTYARLSIQVSLNFADLGRYQADIALRMSSPGDENLLGRKVVPVHCGLFASKTYLETRGLPATAEDLRTHSLIGSDGALAELRQVKSLEALAPVGTALSTDCVSVQIALARAHLGIGPFPCFMAAEHPDLVRVVPDFDIPVDLWILMNPDLKSNPAVRAVYDVLVAAARDDAELFRSGTT